MSTAEVVAIGLILVFGLLILITGVLYLLPILLRLLEGSKKDTGCIPAPASKEPPACMQTPKKDEQEIIAAIMAAISMEEEAQGVLPGNFRVVSFKRIGRKRI